AVSVLADSYRPGIPVGSYPSIPSTPVWSQSVWASGSTSPTLSWPASTDAGSGGVSYQVGLGSSAGAMDVVSWVSVGSVTSYSFSGLSLTNGASYFAVVRALDSSGNVGPSVRSSAFTVDTVAPSPPNAVVDQSVATSLTSSPSIS
ncbi:MAG: hypothetical protein HC902_12245, partial [Calothrix sp. SM1_5_4]|nr:hypothetical protein [Calothrix sp. SM1_5_4]